MKAHLDVNGSLDIAARAIEAAAISLATVWDEGELRLSESDLRKIARALSQIKVSTSRVRDAVKLFEGIALKKDGPRLLHTLARHADVLEIRGPEDAYHLDVSLRQLTDTDPRHD